MIKNPEALPQSPGMKAVMGHFNKILDIPRPSGNEEQMRQYLIKYAEKNGFEWQRDEVGNVAINIKASEGCEDKPRVILQGHMDIVAKGGNDKEPTEAIVQDGWLKSNGQTTLGADNGMGVSYALALAEDESIKHGPMTLLFTVDEEVGMSGISKLDPKILPTGDKEIIIINLDAEEGATKVCNGCAGGVDVEGDFDLDKEPSLSGGMTVIELRLEGLPGGHSGVDRHEPRGNAIGILNYLLQVTEGFLMTKKSKFKMMTPSGGEKRNQIPSEARCTIAVEPKDAAEVKALLAGLLAKIKESGLESHRLSKEMAAKAKLEINELDLEPIVDETRRRIQKAIGDICALNLEIDPSRPRGGVITSNNLGVVTKEDGGKVLRVANLVRSADPDKKEDMAGKVAEILRRNGATVKMTHDYPGWLEPKDAKAIQIIAKVIEEITGEVATIFDYHAGLESGQLRLMLQNLFEGVNVSAVSYGPRITGAHSVDEMVDLESAERVYEILVSSIERIAA